MFRSKGETVSIGSFLVQRVFETSYMDSPPKRLVNSTSRVTFPVSGVRKLKRPVYVGMIPAVLSWAMPAGSKAPRDPVHR